MILKISHYALTKCHSNASISHLLYSAEATIKLEEKLLVV